MSNQPPPPPPGDSWDPNEQSQPNEPSQPSEQAQPFEPPQTDYAEQQQGYGTPQYQSPTQPSTYDQGQPPYQGGAPQYQQGDQHYGQGGQAYSGQPGTAQGTMTESEEKTWSILAHLSAPIAALVSVGMLNFVGPLIIWAIYKDRSPRVRHAAAGAFNFNLSLWIFYAVLVAVSLLTFFVALIVTIPVGIVVWVASMVIHVMAAIKANNGEIYNYPFQIPVLK